MIFELVIYAKVLSESFFFQTELSPYANGGVGLECRVFSNEIISRQQMQRSMIYMFTWLKKYAPFLSHFLQNFATIFRLKMLLCFILGC